MPVSGRKCTVVGIAGVGIVVVGIVVCTPVTQQQQYIEPVVAVIVGQNTPAETECHLTIQQRRRRFQHKQTKNGSGLIYKQRARWMDPRYSIVAYKAQNL